MGGSGRGDPAFRVTGEGSNPPAEISFFSLKIFKNVYCVCLKNQVHDNRCKHNFGGRFLSRS